MQKHLKIYQNRPNEKHLAYAKEVLLNKGIIIYPTDSIYGLGCLADQKKALKRLDRIKEKSLSKTPLSFLFSDFTQLSTYVAPLDTAAFRLLKRTLPGPYTFILKVGKKLPEPFHKRKQIGVRIPNHPVLAALLKILPSPIVSTSLHDDDAIIDYTTDTEEIYNNFENKIDIMIDSGPCGNVPSTLVDLTVKPYKVLREGKGALDLL